MKNPYDIYNDNRAHMGYRRGVNEALDEFVNRYVGDQRCKGNCLKAETCLGCIVKKIKEELNEK